MFYYNKLWDIKSRVSARYIRAFLTLSGAETNSNCIPKMHDNVFVTGLLRGKDTDKVIETQQGADDFFVGFHDDVNSGADTFVHQL